ncbi:hypothetical protein [Streptomyces sp. NPDC058092]|uniref:hypothetical protein n=1 Tax=Streptomyces sp. NPDC058092 TaxID=3346336 RepID=UPI0036F114D2
MSAPVRESEDGVAAMGIEKRMAIQAVLGLTVLAVAIFGYVEVFTKGVDRLPAKVCSGAVDREIVAKILPSTMTAHERARTVDPFGESFVFSCNVKTRSQDSIVSGDGLVHDASFDDWREGYGHGRDKGTFEVRAGGVSVIASPDDVSMYVPCTPPGKKPEEARNAYALIVESRAIGETRATGMELRQAVTDFSYQLLKYNYKIQQCQEAQELPDKLPRFK